MRRDQHPFGRRRRYLQGCGACRGDRRSLRRLSLHDLLIDSDHSRIRQHGFRGHAPARGQRWIVQCLGQDEVHAITRPD